MAKIIEFKVKPKRNKEIPKFLEQLEITKELYLQGNLDKVIIIANGQDLKCCSSNGVTESEAKAICNDFLVNIKEYVD